MATCGWCRRDMLTAHGCVRHQIDYPDGSSLGQILWDGPAGERCHDCGVIGVKTGRKYPHHPGCDVERCPNPKCKGQLISCGCLDTEDDKKLAEQMRRDIDAWEQKRKETQYG